MHLVPHQALTSKIVPLGLLVNSLQQILVVTGRYQALSFLSLWHGSNVKVGRVVLLHFKQGRGS